MGGAVLAATAPPPPRRYYPGVPYQQVVVVEGSQAAAAAAESESGVTCDAEKELLVLVACPLGVRPGQAIEIEVRGHAYRVTVPVGLRSEGQSFYVRVPKTPPLPLASSQTAKQIGGGGDHIRVTVVAHPPRGVPPPPPNHLLVEVRGVPPPHGLPFPLVPGRPIVLNVPFAGGSHGFFKVKVVVPHGVGPSRPLFFANVPRPHASHTVTAATASAAAQPVVKAVPAPASNASAAVASNASASPDCNASGPVPTSCCVAYPVEDDFTSEEGQGAPLAEACYVMGDQPAAPAAPAVAPAPAADWTKTPTPPPPAPSVEGTVADANPFLDDETPPPPPLPPSAPGSSDWVVTPLKAESDVQFVGAGPGAVTAKGWPALSPPQVKALLLPTGLPTGALRQVWELSDVDRDGLLDQDEFAVAVYLCRSASAGQALPATLPENVIPPSKRNPF